MLTLEQFCRKHRYHLWYCRISRDLDEITHNYWNGENKLGRSTEVGEWSLNIGSTVLAHSLMLSYGTGRAVPAPVGTGKTKADARRDMLACLEGGTLYRPTIYGHADITEVPELR